MKIQTKFSYLKKKKYKKLLQVVNVRNMGMACFCFCFKFKKKGVGEKKKCQNILIIREHINHKGTHINHRNMRGVLAFRDWDFSLCE